MVSEETKEKLRERLEKAREKLAAARKKAVEVSGEAITTGKRVGKKIVKAGVKEAIAAEKTITGARIRLPRQKILRRPTARIRKTSATRALRRFADSTGPLVKEAPIRQSIPKHNMFDFEMELERDFNDRWLKGDFL